MASSRAWIGTTALSMALHLASAGAQELARAPAPGLGAALGPAAAAWPDPGAAPFGNPALLTFFTRPELVAEGGLHDGRRDLERLTLAWSGAGATRFGFGLARRTAAPAAAGPEDHRLLVHGGAARALGAGLSIGGAVTLGRHADGGALDTSYGADVGVHVRPWARRSAGGPGPQLGLGLLLRNAVAPRLHLGAEPRSEPRRLEVGLALQQAAGARLALGGVLGVAAERGAAPQPVVGARAGWNGRLEIAGSWSPDVVRAGTALAWGPARLAWVVDRDAGATAHRLSVHAGFGATLDERRTRQDAALEAEIARRLGLEIEARRDRQLRDWLAEADAAMQRRDFAQAAELYRNVLTWNRDDAEAGRGLRRARFALQVQAADSLAAQHDLAAARTALEEALELCPGDSLATARLHDVQADLDQVRTRRAAVAERFRDGLEAYAQQRWADAARSFEAVLALAPGDADAATYLAQAQAAAAAQVQEALHDARARLERHDLDGARAALAPVLAGDANQPEANRILAQIGREQERLDEEQRLALGRRAAASRAAVEHGREDRSPPGIPAAQVAGTYERGLALYRGGDLVGAMQAWEEVARSVPHYQEVDRYLLRVYRVCGLESYTEGRLRQAVDNWEKALRLEPGNAQVRRYLNQAHAKLRRAESGESAR